MIKLGNISPPCRPPSLSSNGPPDGDLSKGKRKEDGSKPHPSSQTPEQTGGGSKGPSSTNKLYKSVKSKVNTRITPPNK